MMQTDEFRISQSLDHLALLFKTKNSNVSFADQLLNELSKISKNLEEQNKTLGGLVVAISMLKDKIKS